MLSVLRTSTMKSEPATPPMRLVGISPGVCGSSAATCVVGGSTEGVFSATGSSAPRAGAAATAAPVASTPVRNLRRSLRAMTVSSLWVDARFLEPALPGDELLPDERCHLLRRRARQGKAVFVDLRADLRARHDGV